MSRVPYMMDASRRHARPCNPVPTESCCERLVARSCTVCRPPSIHSSVFILGARARVMQAGSNDGCRGYGCATPGLTTSTQHSARNINGTCGGQPASQPASLLCAQTPPFCLSSPLSSPPHRCHPLSVHSYHIHRLSDQRTCPIPMPMSTNRSSSTTTTRPARSPTRPGSQPQPNPTHQSCRSCLRRRHG